jgi:hypothetical protein
VTNPNRWLAATALCAALWAAAAPAAAATQDAKTHEAKTQEQLAKEDRIAELERKVDALADELEREREARALPEESGLESVFGMGPGASRIYEAGQGLSVGGYAEGAYTAFVSDKTPQDRNRIDLARAVLYVGYKFSDRVLFNSEIEFEHGGTEATASSDEPGSVSVEFAALDFMLRDEANARAGLLLVPMGFINEMHEPPFYFGTHRPEVEQRILPSTWSESGFGLFGHLFSEQVQYKLYAVSSLNAVGFDASGLREGRQGGNDALAENMAFVGRVDFTPGPQLLVGGSLFVGNAGQSQSFGPIGVPATPTTLWEVHGQYRNRGLQVRALFTMAHVGDAQRLSLVLGSGLGGVLDPGEAVASRMLGAYAEIAYDVWQWISPGSQVTLEPFYRYEYVDTQFQMPRGFAPDGTQRNQIHTVGVNFEPIPNVVLKMDYRNRSALTGSSADMVDAGIGLVF